MKRKQKPDKSGQEPDQQDDVDVLRDWVRREMEREGDDDYPKIGTERRRKTVFES
jgi:hypothetical protein